MHTHRAVVLCAALLYGVGTVGPMARIRPKRPAELDAARIEGADLLVVTWLFRQVTAPRGAHWDVCAPDLSLSSATFDVGVGGGCPTCEYFYDAATLTLSCSCGARTRTFEVPLGGADQPRILAELAALAAELAADSTVADTAAGDVAEGLDGLAGRPAEIDAEQARYAVDPGGRSDD